MVGVKSTSGWRIRLRCRCTATWSCARHGSVAARMRTLSRAPFSITPKGRVNLLLPSHGLALRGGQAQVVAVDASGEPLGEDVLPPLRTLDPLLFDLHTPSRLAPVLNTQPVPIRRRAGSYAFSSSTLSVTTPQTNAATGELVLPDLAAGYASATLVLASGRTSRACLCPQSTLCFPGCSPAARWRWSSIVRKTCTAPGSRPWPAVTCKAVRPSESSPWSRNLRSRSTARARARSARLHASPWSPASPLRS